MTIPSYIKNLISQGEGQYLDFKYEISDARKIARTLVAFANTKGGKLLIGVNDDGSVAGIKSFEEYYMAEKAGNQFCNPVVPFQIKEWKAEGRKILEITIHESNTKPHYAMNDQNQWRVYVRIQDQNHVANRIIVSAFLKKARNQGIFIEYSENEKILLRYLELNPYITEDIFISLTQMGRRKAGKVISNLIALGILEFNKQEYDYIFSLNQGFTDF